MADTPKIPKKPVIDIIGSVFDGVEESFKNRLDDINYRKSNFYDIDFIKENLLGDNNLLDDGDEFDRLQYFFSQDQNDVFNDGNPNFEIPEITLEKAAAFIDSTQRDTETYNRMRYLTIALGMSVTEAENFLTILKNISSDDSHFKEIFLVSIDLYQKSNKIASKDPAGALIKLLNNEPDQKTARMNFLSLIGYEAKAATEFISQYAHSDSITFIKALQQKLL